MKIFLWKRLEHVGERWHEEGGLVVVAHSIECAIEIATSNGVVVSIDNKPDAEYEIDVVDPVGEAIFIFPDAGCC